MPVALIKTWKYLAVKEFAASTFVNKRSITSKRGIGSSMCWVHQRMQNMGLPSSHKWSMKLSFSWDRQRAVSNAMQSTPKAFETSGVLQRFACLLFVLMKEKRSRKLRAATLSTMLMIKTSLKKSILMEGKRKKFVVFSAKSWKKNGKDDKKFQRKVRYL